MGHDREWVQACKTGGLTTCHFGYSGTLTEAVLLGSICIRNGGEKLLWDSANLKFTNSPEANRLLHYAYRPGWSL